MAKSRSSRGRSTRGRSSIISEQINYIRNLNNVNEFYYADSQNNTVTHTDYNDCREELTEIIQDTWDKLATIGAASGYIYFISVEEMESNYTLSGAVITIRFKNQVLITITCISSADALNNYEYLDKIYKSFWYREIFQREQRRRLLVGNNLETNSEYDTYGIADMNLAIAAAESYGNTFIDYVGTSGQFTEEIILKNGVDLVFNSNTITAAPSSGLFNDDAQSVTCNIYGDGRFFNDGSGGSMDSRFMTVNGVSSDVFFKFHTIESNGNISGQRNTFQEGGKLYLKGYNNLSYYLRSYDNDITSSTAKIDYDVVNSICTVGDSCFNNRIIALMDFYIRSGYFNNRRDEAGNTQLSPQTFDWTLGGVGISNISLIFCKLRNDISETSPSNIILGVDGSNFNLWNSYFYSLGTATIVDNSSGVFAETNYQSTCYGNLAKDDGVSTVTGTFTVDEDLTFTQ